MDTIFALSSGKGKAGVSVIRVSGVKAFYALKEFSIEGVKPRQASLKKLKNAKGKTIDHALVLAFENPALNPKLQHKKHKQFVKWKVNLAGFMKIGVLA